MMKKVIKKFTLIFLSVVAVVFGCVGLSACLKGGDDNWNENAGSGEKNDNESVGSLYGKWAEYDGVKIAFADEATYNDGELKENRVLPELNCKFGEKQYMIIDFDIQAPYDNDGRETVTAAVQIQPAAAVAATIQDTNSGTVSNETKDDITEITATYKIPETADSVRNMRLVIQVEAKDRGSANVDLSFQNSGEIQGVKTEKIEMSVIMGYTEELEYDGETVVAISDIGVKEIIIPSIFNGEHITVIGRKAFYECKGITSVTIPYSVISIGENVFESSIGTKIKVDYTGDIANWCSISGRCSVNGIWDLIEPYWTWTLYIKGKELKGELIIPDSVTNISDGAFCYCSGLTSITIPDSVTSIGDSAFQYCSGLTSITIPDSVNSIGRFAFSGCSGLTSITIPNSVNSIGKYTFRGCSGLTSITIPADVVNIGERAFWGCSGLESIAVASGNTEYKSENNSILTKDGTTLILGCKNSIIPNGVTSIGDNAFSGCTGLISITMPDSVTSIGKYAFNSCTGLISITIPDSVTSIGDCAFSGCSGLTSITIPNGVTSIGRSAFYGCRGLTSITIPDSVISIDDDAFYGCSGLTSITFKGTIEQWKAVTKETGWNSNTGEYTVHCTDEDLTKAEAG